jgi:hypothetical protein
MKIQIGVVLAILVVSFGRMDAKTSTLSGESCVAKCLRGGASVGHPEWLPQRMVLVSDDGKTTWIVENPDTLINQAGQHVLVDAQFGKNVNNIRILRLCSK